MKYNPSIIEKKWQKKWADKKVFKAKIDYNKPKYAEFTGDKENYDYVIRFENLADDYKEMCKKFNIDKTYYELPHLYNSSYDKKKNFLSEEAKEAIRDYSNVYARIFGYDF